MVPGNRSRAEPDKRWREQRARFACKTWSAMHKLYHSKQYSRNIREKIWIIRAVTSQITSLTQVYNWLLYVRIVYGTFDSPHVVSLICPLHCRPIHHTHPAQRETWQKQEKKTKHLIHDLQLLCCSHKQNPTVLFSVIVVVLNSGKKTAEKKACDMAQSQDTCLRTYSVFFCCYSCRCDPLR